MGRKDGVGKKKVDVSNHPEDDAFSRPRGALDLNGYQTWKLIPTAHPKGSPSGAANFSLFSATQRGPWGLPFWSRTDQPFLFMAVKKRGSGKPYYPVSDYWTITDIN